VIVDGENEQMAPVGKFEQDRATELWNDPETGVIVTSELAGLPALTSRADGAASKAMVPVVCGLPEHCPENFTAADI
jgi:hypothetical protein